MERIRVLHVIKSLGRGGAETLLAESLRVHDTSRFEFHCIYFLPWKDQLVSTITRNGGHVVCISARNNLALLLRWRKVARYVKDNKIHIIHAHLPWAGFVARIVCKMTHATVIYTEHNDQDRYNRITYLINRLTFNWQSLAIAVSADVKKSILARIPVRVPVLVVRNGVDTDKYARDLAAGNSVRKEHGIPEHAIVIGTVAVFRVQKRLADWLARAREILNTHKDTYFIVVGDGPEKDSLITKRQEWGLAERVIMPGLQSEVRPWMSAMNIFMMTSLFEGLPIALLEAMSMECAVVTTDAGGIKEVVRHEVEGLVSPVGEPRLLSGFALDLINSESRRTKFARTARDRVVRDFSLIRMVRELEEVYTSVLSKRSN